MTTSARSLRGDQKEIAQPFHRRGLTRYITSLRNSDFKKKHLALESTQLDIMAHPTQQKMRSSNKIFKKESHDYYDEATQKMYFFTHEYCVRITIHGAGPQKREEDGYLSYEIQITARRSGQNQSIGYQTLSCGNSQFPCLVQKLTSSPQRYRLLMIDYQCRALVTKPEYGLSNPVLWEHPVPLPSLNTHILAPDISIIDD
uniref:Uncharacterized protein n=1 Tax=Timema cristinae TaxID=61476 RepID=A0A7R9CSJ4_TIMCR|nr:unnamed protein product [Timema cristinae]